MCGISGFVDFNKTLSETDLRIMNDTLMHRGPDDSGVILYKTECSYIGLAQRRLSIIDLSALGHQPMNDHTGRYSIIFNGEVYNYKEIATELRGKGYSFNSSSDTEVILYALIEYGISAVKKFIGMFSIVFYDIFNCKLYLIRDRAGVKPLYYYINGQSIYFASELKAFHKLLHFNKVLNLNAVQLYFRYGYISDPLTIFKDTFKISSASYMIFDCRSGEREIIKYWDIKEIYNNPHLDITEDQAIEETEKILKSAFNYRMVSDVPLGLFLSGGYDSATLAAVLQKESSIPIKTFTIGFEFDAYNESKFAKQIAKHLGTEHFEFFCTKKEALALIPSLSYNFDEPFGDASAIPTMLVCQHASKEVKVVLSADGGDEVFGGYNRYGYLLAYDQLKKKVPEILLSLSGRMAEWVRMSEWPFIRSNPGLNHRLQLLCKISRDKSIIGQNERLIEKFTSKELKCLFKIQYEMSQTSYFADHGNILTSENDLSKILVMDWQTYMIDDILVKVDRCTMSNSIEGREPYLDHRLIEWVARLPVEMKFRNGVKKHILKTIAHKYIPKEMLDRPKIGFGVPLEHWFQKELRPLLDEFLNEGEINKSGILDFQYVNKIRKYFDKFPSENVAEKLWLILTFQMWWKKWMN